MGFRCKQFTIEDSQCAMKVGTDSLMLGSWVEVKGAKHILDIGTGSGLLGLMLAQKTENFCQIEGIDIDQNAIRQAKNNALNSSWSQKLKFYQVSLQKHFSANQYDLIVSNPPYFTENISANKRANKTNRQSARQTLTLDHQTLIQHVADKLASQGRFYCILPTRSVEPLCELAKTFDLYCVASLNVLTKPKGEVSRVLMEFIREQTKLRSQQMIIYNFDGSYSDDYKALCKDYYLNF